MKEKRFGALGGSILVLFVLMSMPADMASAQLMGCQQIDGGGTVTLPFGTCIARSLEDQVDLGHTDTITGTPGSGNIETGSIYLIKHDPARSIRRGRQLFQRKFTEDDGQGPRVNNSSTGDITQMRALGAGLMDSCAGCHGRPRGSAGFGGVVQTFGDSRDSPHLFGLGLAEQLADEMTDDLRAIRDQAVDDALGGGTSQTLVDEDFDSGTFGGFSFQDDAQDPAYTSGTVVFLGSDGVAQITLGGIDNADIFNMEAGLTTTFNMTSAANVTLELNWRLLQAPDYESNEVSQAYVEVDGNRTVLGTFTGNGNGGPFQDTGEQFASIDLGSLAAGNHTLFLAGFNNQKTFNNEFTQAFYNNVTLTTDASCPIVASLDTKGVNFGTIEVACNGDVDYSNVEGVDADPNEHPLRIRPFFAQGNTVSIREFIFGAMNDEMGIQIDDPILCAVTDPGNPQTVTSPSGFEFDPSEDRFERPPGCGNPSEVDVAVVDHLEFYLLNYFKPGRYMQTTRTQQGDALMDTIGCTTCHVRNLTVNNDRRVADVETGFNPTEGIFNELKATASTRFVVEADPSSPFPFVLPAEESFVVENIFTDFKRHDLGPDFDERDFDGTVITEHITEPLWGVGSTAPYGHDGRSINLDAVIRRHGGDAAASTAAYAALSDSDQRKILEFLNTLILFPPDDTASNLEGGEGNPGTGDPQDPMEHGFINLGALFQIDNSDIGLE
ncbi:MAG: di-heme oxidoredictase family protein [Acidobacteriota bacterium]